MIALLRYQISLTSCTKWWNSKQLNEMQVFDQNYFTDVGRPFPHTVFLISSYGTPLVQRASYLALHSSLFGTVNYDYIVTNSINSLAQDVFPMAHTLTIVEPFWPMLQNYQKLWCPYIVYTYISFIIRSLVPWENSTCTLARDFY